MSDITERFFWCDRPSPLHVRMDELMQARNAAIDDANKLAKRFGATAMVFQRDMGRGVVFKSGTSPDASWIEKGYCEEQPYFLPRRTTAERKRLYEQITKTRVPSIQDALKDFGLYICGTGTSMGRMCIQFSGLGMKDDRLFVRIPVSGKGCSGDKFPKIPPFLTECKEWEYQRWFAEGRAAIEAAA